MVWASRPVGLMASHIFLGGAAHATLLGSASHASGQSLLVRKGPAVLVPLLVAHGLTALLWRAETKVGGCPGVHRMQTPTSPSYLVQLTLRLSRSR